MGVVFEWAWSLMGSWWAGPYLYQSLQNPHKDDAAIMDASSRRDEHVQSGRRHNGKAEHPDGWVETVSQRRVPKSNPNLGHTKDSSALSSPHQPPIHKPPPRPAGPQTHVPPILLEQAPPMPGHASYWPFCLALDPHFTYLLAANFWQMNPPGIWVTM